MGSKQTGQLNSNQTIIVLQMQQQLAELGMFNEKFVNKITRKL